MNPLESNHSFTLEKEIESMLSNIINDSESESTSLDLSSDFSPNNSTPFPNSSTPFNIIPSQIRLSKKTLTYTSHHNSSHFYPPPPLRTPVHSSSTITSFSHLPHNINKLISETSSILQLHEQITKSLYLQIQDHFISIIQTQNGSHLFNNYLKKTPYEIIHLIFNDIKYNILNVITNINSNYFCKKFFGILNKKDRIELLNIILPHFCYLSLDNVGTFPIQSYIEQSKSHSEKKMIINIINEHLNEFCYNIYGSHIIEKIILLYEHFLIKNILDYILHNFISLSTHQSGICVIKAFLIYIGKKGNDDYVYVVKNIIIDNFNQIVCHKFANQVIHTVISFWEYIDSNDVIQLVEKNVAELSLGKYSSTVIETFIEKNGMFLYKYIVNIVNLNKVGIIMGDIYGNYVIQKALKIAKGNILNILIMNINMNLFMLNDEKLIMKWKGIVNGCIL